jgi:hypothetical protein
MALTGESQDKVLGLEALCTTIDLNGLMDILEVKAVETSWIRAEHLNAMEKAETKQTGPAPRRVGIPRRKPPRRGR